MERLVRSFKIAKKDMAKEGSEIIIEKKKFWDMPKQEPTVKEKKFTKVWRRFLKNNGLVDTT